MDAQRVMQVIESYPIEVEHWLHLPINHFTGVICDYAYNYILGISPEDPKDPKCCYFNVRIEKKMTNETTGQTVFYAKTFSCFKVKNNYQKPTAEFYFSLISEATNNFALLFQRSTQSTNLAHRTIRKPVYSTYRKSIEKAIDIWDRTVRNRIHLPRPNWQEAFQDLPKIPEHKRWVDGSYTTTEQDIALALLHGQPITTVQEKIFTELTSFYDELDSK